MVDELHRNYSSAAYVFRNNYFFLDLPPAPHETSNITFLRYRQKVYIIIIIIVWLVRYWTVSFLQAYSCSTCRLDDSAFDDKAVVRPMLTWC